MYLINCWAETLEDKAEALAVNLDIAKAFDRHWLMLVPIKAL